MINNSTLSTPPCNSPKTPGGISKSLLTPCRRVGLSRNWKKKGPSPFISPLPNEITEQQCSSFPQDQTETTNNTDNCSNSKETLVFTPQRSGRSKSKKSFSKKNVDLEPEGYCSMVKQTVKVDIHTPDKENHNKNFKNSVATDDLSTQEVLKESAHVETIIISEMPEIAVTPPKREQVTKLYIKSKSITKKPKSPENLTKECFVVIQKKLLPKDENDSPNMEMTKNIQDEKKNTILDGKKELPDKIRSQTLFDSDSDDIPLKCIKKIDINKRPRDLVMNDDEDFIETKPGKVKKLENKNTSSTESKVKKLEDKSTSVTSLKANKKNKIDKTKKGDKVNPKPSQLLNDSIDDFEDFDLTSKKTILIRKSYDKVITPSRAKSTGSITQKDIDDLKARIEMKKNQLLAKVMTKDTEELRDLIKKWRKGCQDALIELMDLMKTKFPDRQNMDYSEILQTLRIPSSLVGYDSDNDCFESPDDAKMILSKFI